MAVRTFIYPVTLNPSVAPSGGTAPIQTTQIGGPDNLGILQPVTMKNVGGDESLSVDVRHSVLPDGAATSANQDTEIASLASIDAKLTDVSTATNQATEIASLASIDSKLTDVATATNQATEIASLSSIDSKLTDVATATNQATEIASLSSIDNKLNTLGQKDMAGSVPVTIASDQSDVPVSVASLPLPSGAATEAKQDVGNTSLSSIDGKLNSLGQKAMANSVPVVISSDQSAISTMELTGLVPKIYDDIVLTYVGATQLTSTVTYKSGGVTVATLTLTYDGSNRLIDVART